MKQAGLDTVRMGEFAWSRIEKAPGQFDFDWMDRTLDSMHEAGLEVAMHANRDTAEMVNGPVPVYLRRGRTVVGVGWFTPSLSIC